MVQEQPAGLADVRAVFAALPPAAGGVPLLTDLDDAAGERTDLSAGELGDWSARTARLLADRFRVGPGDRCAVLLPPHWQTAAVLLGAWSTGAAVEFRPWATAGLAPAAAAEPAAALFVSAARLGSWLEEVPRAWHRFVLPLGGPLGDPPEGYQVFPDILAGVAPAGAAALGGARSASPDGATHRQWGAVARELAGRAGIGPGDRVLVDADDPALDQPLRWLLAPLSVGASIVVCRGADAAARARVAAREGVTHVLGTASAPDLESPAATARP